MMKSLWYHGRMYTLCSDRIGKELRVKGEEGQMKMCTWSGHILSVR